MVSCFSNKVIEASQLPKIVICNPRSVYNKITQLKTFILEEDVDIMCLSETWERVEQPLASVLGLDGYEIISNPFCRTNRGGRPAIIINSSKFNVQNLSQTEIPTEWKTECVWAMVSLKNTTNSSRIKKIIIATSLHLKHIKMKYFLTVL